MNDRLTVGSLFSGVGGIDLGLERAGMRTKWFVEWDAHCQNILRRHWTGLPVAGDITAVDWSAVEPVDVLAGGFPCQPVSIAGNRGAQADDRWLWPEFTRAIRVLRPRYVFVENVRNLLAVNSGSAFGEVLGDLASLGFDAEWDCIPAVAVGANHERDRLWLVAYANGNAAGGGTGELQGGQSSHREPPQLLSDPRGGSRASEAGDHRRPELQGTLAHAADGGSRDSIRSGRDALGHGGADVADPDGGRREPGGGRPSERGVPFPYSLSDGGRFDWWSAEPRVGRVAHGVPHRVDRLRSLGNAVVPQVVEFIGRAIVAFDEGEEIAA